VIVFNLKQQGVWCARLEEKSPGVPSAAIKNPCWAVYIVLLGFPTGSLNQFGTPDGTHSVRLRDPVRRGPPWALGSLFPKGLLALSGSPREQTRTICE